MDPIKYLPIPELGQINKHGEQVKEALISAQKFIPNQISFKHEHVPSLMIVIFFKIKKWFTILISR